MKKIKLVGIFLFSLGFSVSLEAQWARTYGGSSEDRARAIQETLDGGYVVAGETRSFGAGSSDVWVLKLSSNGELEWHKAYGGPEFDIGHSIQQTYDKRYIVAGALDKNLWVLKLTEGGEIEWQKAYGGEGHDEAYSILQTAEGGYAAAGYTNTNERSNDFWVLKLDPSGNIEWQKAYGGNESEIAYCLVESSEGGYVVVGEAWSIGAGRRDFWVLKLTKNGDIEWQKAFGGSDDDTAYAVIETLDKGYIVTGSAGTTGGTWILKLSKTGDLEWQRTYGESAARSVRQTLDGGMIIAGKTRFISQEENFCILKITPTGELEWRKAFGGGLSDQAYAIQQTLDGNYVVAGNTNSFASEVTRFGRDVMVIKLSPSGILSTQCDLKKAQDTEIAETNADKKDTSVSPRETTVQPQDMVISFGNYDIYDVVMNDFCRGQYILCLQSVEDGLTEPPSGIHWYEPGTTVTIKAIAYDKHKFIGWWGDALGSVNPITITMDSHKSIRPGFMSTELGGGGNWFGGDFSVGPCFIASAVMSPRHTTI